MIYVLDASFVAGLIIPDEKNLIVGKMFDKIENDDERYVPQLFWYEITNIFRNLIRRKRFTAEEVMEFYPLLAVICLNHDFETGIEYSRKILRLCNDYNITSYDAAYLELAERKNAVFCTLDENLSTVAEKHNIAVIHNIH